MSRRLSDELLASARRRRSGRANSRYEARGPIEQRALSAVRLGGDPMTVSAAFDAAGRRRSPATMPGYHAGRAPRNKGQHYPADPPTVEEIIAVMRQTRDDRHGFRVRALIVVLWRAGLRGQEALARAEPDLDERRGSLLVRSGKGGRRREIGMDAWGWERLRPWLGVRADLPVGPLFCVIDGPTRGRAWSAAAVRLELHRLALQAGVRR